MRFYEVAVPAPLAGALTYAVPDALVDAVVPGRRVLVPLGSRRLTGVAVRPAADDASTENAREILRALDDGPLLPSDVLALVLFAADYYLCPLGLAVRAALPPGIDVTETRALALTDLGRAALEGNTLPASQRRVLGAIASGVGVSSRVQDEFLAASLAIEVTEEQTPRTQAPSVEIAQVLPGAESRLAEISRSLAQKRLLEYLIGRGAVPLEEIVAAFPTARALLKKLAARDLVSLSEIAAGPAVIGAGPWDAKKAPDPNADQRAAVEAIAASLGSYAPFLLHGVTGSGKTEVYLRAIAEARARKLGAVVLVPEIALTPQLAGRFRARFGDDVAVLHSGLSPSERLGEWRRVRAGDAGIVVGARSAIFAPVQNPGLFVVDEEHEPSYKQDESPRYNGRDLAVKRASIVGAPVVLGSATPSLETLRNAREGRYRLLTLPSRIDDRPLPVVRLVSLRNLKRPSAASRETGLFTQELGDALAATLSRGEQAIIFLNRRGHSTVVLCRACGLPVRCPNCDLSLTHHQGARRLVCHTCGHTALAPDVCPSCGAAELLLLGAGTEKVEEELASFFPAARALRLDADTTRARGATAAILAKFARHEADVLVGTQMVAKGHDFPGVTLVGVLCADAALRLPDFRSAERCFQLLTQVAGRAGRGTLKGEVIVQAFAPDAPAIRCAQGHDFLSFAESELNERRDLGYPPFSRLVLLRFEGEDAAATEAGARQLSSLATRAARSHKGVQVLGPAPAPLPRLRGRWRWQALIRGTTHGPLAHVASEVLAAPRPSGLRVIADVDPGSLL